MTNSSGSIEISDKQRMEGILISLMDKGDGWIAKYEFLKGALKNTTSHIEYYSDNSKIHFKNCTPTAKHECCSTCDE